MRSIMNTRSWPGSRRRDWSRWRKVRAP